MHVIAHGGMSYALLFASESHTRHMSHVTRRMSHVTRRTSHSTRRTSHVARHTSHVTRHTSHVTRRTSHSTRRTSHVARHTSHVTRHRRRHCRRRPSGARGSEGQRTSSHRPIALAAHVHLPLALQPHCPHAQMSQVVRYLLHRQDETALMSLVWQGACPHAPPSATRFTSRAILILSTTL